MFLVITGAPSLPPSHPTLLYPSSTLPLSPPHLPTLPLSLPHQPSPPTPIYPSPTLPLPLTYPTSLTHPTPLTPSSTHTTPVTLSLPNPPTLPLSPPHSLVNLFWGSHSNGKTWQQPSQMSPPSNLTKAKLLILFCCFKDSAYVKNQRPFTGRRNDLPYDSAHSQQYCLRPNKSFAKLTSPK
ncbi:hypothetical protein Pmani_025060 [Petrolisthes manimaculis]|uniref:Uncharacterized protein n=1 Tax=Petrolisthes manimaculis TaxID=1843537 RepID=A0AAE1P6A1_9EUCA|nr:hypothetical protein Pmani_025060 [Petrolisthes manimaculis]